MAEQEVTVFEGSFRNTVYAFALDKDAAIKAVEDCVAFGNPHEDEYAIGQSWAEGQDEDGWQIIERTLTIVSVYGRVLGDFGKNEVVHLAWACPYCNRGFSEDFHEVDERPLLLKCGCCKDSYVLVHC